MPEGNAKLKDGGVLRTQTDHHSAGSSGDPCPCADAIAIRGDFELYRLRLVCTRPLPKNTEETTVEDIGEGPHQPLSSDQQSLSLDSFPEEQFNQLRMLMIESENNIKDPDGVLTGAYVRLSILCREASFPMPIELTTNADGERTYSFNRTAKEPPQPLRQWFFQSSIEDLRQ